MDLRTTIKSNTGLYADGSGAAATIHVGPFIMSCSLARIADGVKVSPLLQSSGRINRTHLRAAVDHAKRVFMRDCVGTLSDDYKAKNEALYAE